jgi:hypothetical protein
MYWILIFFLPQFHEIFLRDPTCAQGCPGDRDRNISIFWNRDKSKLPSMNIVIKIEFPTYRYEP